MTECYGGRVAPELRLLLEIEVQDQHVLNLRFNAPGYAQRVACLCGDEGMIESVTLMRIWIEGGDGVCWRHAIF
jgi:hypothetical protein